MTLWDNTTPEVLELSKLILTSGAIDSESQSSRNVPELTMLEDSCELQIAAVRKLSPKLAHATQSWTRNTLENDFYVLVSTGIKPNSLGELTTAPRSYQDLGTRFSLEDADASVSDDSWFSDTNSDSDLDTDDDELLYDDGEEYGSDEDQTLSGPEFLNAILYLVGFSSSKIRDWMPSARYAVPPKDRLPPRKRAKSPRSRHCEDRDESNPNLVVISRVDGYFHLACPFYAHDPEKYQSCLQQCDFRCIEEIISHLRKHHARPPYCPKCWQTFEKAMHRDSHIRTMTCVFHDKRTIHGINKDQEERIKHQDKLYLVERTRWLRIWTTIFPHTNPQRSPYLKHGVERRVCMIRDFWAKHGMGWVLQYVEQNDFLHQHQWDKQKLVPALYRSVLRSLLQNLSIE